MENILFKNVICKGYLQKQNTKHVCVSTEDDKYLEDEHSITLNQGGYCEQNKYKFIEKEFEGICVGIFSIYQKREYIDCINDNDYGRNEQYILTNLKETISVAKIFYGNNRSRIVPLDKVEIWQSTF